MMFFPSCAFHGGMITSTPNYPSGHKYEYVDVAFGYSACNYFLGMGGVGKEALISQAKAKLISSYTLQPGQSFENFVLNTKFSIVGPFSKLSVLAMADVMQRDSSFVISYSKNFTEILGKPRMSGNLMYIENEEVNVFDKKTKLVFPARILKVGTQKSTVILLSVSEALKIKVFSNDNLFKIKPLQNFKIKNNIQLGDTVLIDHEQEIGRAHV